MKKNHLYNGFSLWTGMEQLPDQLMFKIWSMFYSQSMILPTSRPLVLIGSTTSSSDKMSLKHDTPNAIITSMSSVSCENPKTIKKWFYSVQITIMDSCSMGLHLMISTTSMRLDMGCRGNPSAGRPWSGPVAVDVHVGELVARALDC